MKSKFSLVAFALVLFTSCAPRIVDTWNIDRYEVVKDDDNTMISKNIGTITFEKGGKGTKNINYNVFQNNFEDKAPFKWKKNGDYMKIMSVGDKKSEFNKTWIIVKDKSSKQVWKSTDGQNSVQIIELSK